MKEPNLHTASSPAISVARRATAAVTEWVFDGDGKWGDDAKWSFGVPCGEQTAVLPTAKTAYTVTITPGKVNSIGSIELSSSASVELLTEAVIDFGADADECKATDRSTRSPRASAASTTAADIGNGQGANVDDPDDTEAPATTMDSKDLSNPEPTYSAGEPPPTTADKGTTHNTDDNNHNDTEVSANSEPAPTTADNGATHNTDDANHANTTGRLDMFDDEVTYLNNSIDVPGDKSTPGFPAALVGTTAACSVLVVCVCLFAALYFCRGKEGQRGGLGGSAPNEASCVQNPGYNQRPENFGTTPVAGGIAVVVKPQYDFLNSRHMPQDASNEASNTGGSTIPPADGGYIDVASYEIEATHLRI
jgi:hypothetical protein